MDSKKLRIGAILPHLLLFGGVRRYIELGNEFKKLGHEVFIYTETGENCDWMRFNGKVYALSDMQSRAHDVMITGSPGYLDFLRASDARLKVFYFQLGGLKEEKRIISSKDIKVMVNSGGLARRLKSRYHIKPLDGIGGINTSMFFPIAESAGNDSNVEFGGVKRAADHTGTFRILCYGRLSRPRKGTRFVVEAASRLFKKGYKVELHLFDSVDECKDDPRLGFKPGVPFRFYMNLPQSSLVNIYNAADVFVSAERRAGWSNTAAEAAACGLPLVSTRSGSEDFAINGETALVVPLRNSFFIERELKRIYRDAELRSRLGLNASKLIKRYSWDKVAAKIEKQFLKLLFHS